MCKLTSIDGSIEIHLNTNSDGLTYTVKKKGQLVIESGSLGLVSSKINAVNGLRLIEQSEREVQDDYSLPVGKKAIYENKYIEYSLWYSKDSQPFNIIFRIYNNGIAFRYAIPGTSGDEIFIDHEATSFGFPEDFNDLWLQDWIASYEHPYNHSTWGHHLDAQHYGMPALLYSKSKNIWVMINEANVLNAESPFCVSHLLGTSEQQLKIEYALEEQGHPIQTALPFESPWRYLLIEDSLDGVVNSTFNHNLNPASVIEDTSWIKPSRALWAWWSSDQGAQLFTEAMEYVDYAAAMGFEAVVIDAGWDSTWMPKLVKYAHDRNVMLWLWTAMQSIADYESANYYLPLWKSWGIDGVKIDFFENDSKYTTTQYRMMAEIMAENKLMINFHGATKNMGEGRTWPHYVTSEGIMGLEHYKWSDMPNAEHNCTVPFIRNVIGPMDYTPTGFTNKNRNTTMAHQMALAAVFESGCTHYSASIYNLQPWLGTQFLRRLKPKYDGLKLLSGYPGDHVAMLRWTDEPEEYIIGCICNDYRIMTLTFDFLGEGEYEVEIYSDTRMGDNITLEKRTITRQDTITLHLPEHGGAGLYITRKLSALVSSYADNYMSDKYVDYPANGFTPLNSSYITDSDLSPTLILKDEAMVNIQSDAEVVKNYTLRLFYSVEDNWRLSIRNNETFRIAEIPSSGGNGIWAVHDVPLSLNPGYNLLIISLNNGATPAISKLRVIDNDPKQWLNFPIQATDISGPGLLEQGDGKLYLVGLEGNSTLTFSDVMLNQGGEYILRLDYVAGVTGFAHVSINGAVPIEAKLAGTGTWSATKSGEVLGREIIVSMSPGSNDIRITASTNLPVITGIRLQELEMTR